jgi:hypothetical protein
MPGPGGPEPTAGGDAFGALSWGAPDMWGEDVHDKWAQIPRNVVGDLYPQDEETYQKMVGWSQAAIQASEDAVSFQQTQWHRMYRLYRSYSEQVEGDWHHNIFVPICFWVIETITPRLVAQLPRFTALPVFRDDVENAKNMEVMLEWASDRSKLFVELVKAFKQSLKYGTGILKTYHRQDIRKGRKTQPLMANLRMPQEQVVAYDLDGYPIVETREVEMGQFQAGYASQKYPYVAYDGPAAEFIDIFNFFPAPESHDIQSARYVIHRNYKDLDEVLRRVRDGVYHLPPDFDIQSMSRTSYDDPSMKRQQSIGSSTSEDPTRKVVELHEIWTKDGRVITVMNRSTVIRVQENPFDHSEKPFVRIVDHLQEGEFWGVGEIEPIMGLQDAHNAITNSRLDNLRLVLNKMFYVNYHHVEDMEDFKIRPGGLIKGRGDYKPEEVFQAIDMGDVTPDAWGETQSIEMLVEKVTGVSDVQMGLDQAGGTATETAIISEMGQSRFGMKSRLIEIEGLTDLGRQWASLGQQFITEERQVRLGLVDEQTGQPAFADLTPESISGAFDIAIETESTAQSQTVRQETAMSLLGVMAQFYPQGVTAALKKLLDAMGIKNHEEFLAGVGPGQPGLPGQPPVETQPGQPPSAGQPAPPAASAQSGSQPPPAPTDPGMNPNPAEGTFGDDSAERLVDEILAGYDQAGAAP